MRADAFIRQARKNVAYNAAGKAKFHRGGREILARLAEHLGYGDSDYDLRNNEGGIAVSGEITLHSDTLYVQLSQSCLGPDQGFMWRTVKHRKDYVGGVNQWAKWEELLDLPKLAAKMKAHSDRVRGVSAHARG